MTTTSDGALAYFAGMPRGLFGRIIQSRTQPKRVVDSSPIWKRIQIGGVGYLDLIAALEARYCLDSWASNMMRQEGFTTLPVPEEALLARLIPSELGYTRPPWQEELYYGGRLEKWANSRGFGISVCPAEVGPHLRLQYDEQPRRGMTLWIAMIPLADGLGNKRSFYLRRDGYRRRSCMLGSMWERPGGEQWQLDTPLVFRLLSTG